jgi:Ca2+-binding EF-hand superfamily protein
MSTISGVGGSGSNAWTPLNTQRINHQAKMFAKVDSDGSGSVDQAELTTMLDKISGKTGASFGDATKVFTSMDTNSDGSLSADELGKGMKSLMQSQSSTVAFAQARKSGGGDPDGDGDGPHGAGGPPPGPPPAGAAGGSSSASGTSSSSTTYDPLDTNQDGTVSLAERLAGNIKSDPVQVLFKAMDTDNNGKVSSSESDAFAKKLTDLVSQASSNNSTATTGSASNQGFDIAKLAQMLYDQVASSLATSSRSTSLSAVA